MLRTYATNRITLARPVFRVFSEYSSNLARIKFAALSLQLLGYRTWTYSSTGTVDEHYPIRCPGRRGDHRPRIIGGGDMIEYNMMLRYCKS